MSVAVVGAGIVGCTTAHLLRQRLDPDIHVTLISSHFDVHTTSYGAAGVFRVSEHGLAEPERLRRWLSLSFDHYWQLARSEAASDAGALQLSMFEMYTDPDPRPPAYLSCCSDAVKVSRPELHRWGFPAECRSAYRYTSVMVESRRYLPFLLDKFEAHGGQVSRRRVDSWAQLSGEFDLAVNCLGLEARRLCGDALVRPVRGQVVRVRAPWLKHGLYLGNPTSYVYPGRDLVVLGGTRQEDVEDRTVSEADTNLILERTLRLEPSLARASVEEVWAGLRPYRPTVRVEADPHSFDLPLVHNYGHGGNGVSLAYGTSAEAAELVEAMLSRVSAKL